MTALIDVGYITPAGQDIFPTTAPHLDTRVLKNGEYINPKSARSLLTRLKIGKERTPLWQQKGQEWIPNFPITSEFGPRAAPVAGASTMHLGQDYGISGGTPLAWEGPGTFIPGKGYGTIKTTDAQGNPYEIRLLHTKGGKVANLSSPVQTQRPSEVQPNSGVDSELNQALAQNTLLMSEFLRQQTEKTKKQDSQDREIKQKTPSLGEQFLAQYLAQKPVDYFGQDIS